MQIWRVILVSHRRRGRHTVRTLQVKGKYATLSLAKQARHAMWDYAERRWGTYPEYEIMNEKQLAQMRVELAQEAKTRHQLGQARARATRAKRTEPRRFVLCPACGKKSHRLYSEHQIEQRECVNHHRFTYDRWLADRAFWNPGATVVYR